MAPFGSLEIPHTKHRGGHCRHVGLGGPAGGTSAHKYLAYRAPELDAAVTRVSTVEFRLYVRGGKDLHLQAPPLREPGSRMERGLVTDQGPDS